MKNFESIPSKVTPEMMVKIREAFAEDLEELFTNPRWLQDSEEDQQILDKVKRGKKLKALGTYLEDILIGVAMKVGRINTLKDIDKLKEEFFE